MNLKNKLKMSWNALALVTAATALATSACRTDSNSQIKENTNQSYQEHIVKIGEFESKVFLPASYDPNRSYKTLVLLHGALVPNAIDLFMDLFSFQDFVNEKDFIIVAPFLNTPVTLYAWNLLDIKTVLDQYLDQLTAIQPSAESVLAGTSIDLEDLFLTGYSGGARAAYMYVSQDAPKYYIKGLIAFAGDGIGGAIVGGDPLKYSRPAYPLSLVHVHASGDYVVPTENGLNTFEAFSRTFCEDVSPLKSISDEVSIRKGLNCSEGTTSSLYFAKKANNPILPHAVNVNDYGLVSRILNKIFR